ncbi:MAG: epoxyqueuosine reductase [Bacteroidales bacterium]|nr:epoxyqueuosine reductase [Bacteroidales bacterium]
MTIFSQEKLKTRLYSQGAEIVRFVDISNLSKTENKGYTSAILIGIVLSADFIRQITDTPDYVEKMIRNKQIKEDEFHIKETQTDNLADSTASYLSSMGYLAYSQSEKNILATGFYTEKTKSTPLPHKTIAGLAGLGWIGKHNLIVIPEFGSALSLCSVLTNAPLETILHEPQESKCGNCNICKNICSVKAIKGNLWNPDTTRDEIVDVFKCNTCLKCLALCVWTQKYMKRNPSDT